MLAVEDPNSGGSAAEDIVNMEDGWGKFMGAN